MDNKVLDEAVMVLVTRLDLNPDYFGAEEIRESFLAGVKVLLGEPVAWQLRCGPPDGMCSYSFLFTSEKNATDKAAHYTRDGWAAEVAALYAPSLGEGE